MTKFVYFDLGGVIISDLSANGEWKKIKDFLQVKPEQDDEFESFFDEYETEVNQGKHFMDEILPILNQKFALKILENYSIEDDMLKRFATNKTIWPILDQIHAEHPIGLLTNMYPGLLNKIKSQNLMPPDEWDVIIDSSEVKLAKPDPGIFKLAEKLAGFSGQEILFVENTQRHIDAAKKFGWQTFLFDPANTQTSCHNLRKMIYNI